MKVTRASVAVVVVCLLASCVQAFDGKRQGFVLGGGLGINVYGKISPEASGDEKQGLAAQFLLGYAQNEHNLMALECNITTHLFVGHGFYGPTWYRYFGRPGKAFFSVLGLGMYYYSGQELFGDPVDHKVGLGYMLGGGCEFARHFQAAAYFAGGHTSSDRVSYDHRQFSILISFTAF